MNLTFTEVGMFSAIASEEGLELVLRPRTGAVDMTAMFPMCDDCSQEEHAADDCPMRVFTAIQWKDDLSWDAVMADPKRSRRHQARSFRTTTYETFHTGGFLRLCTERGRIYWVAQNELEHTTPDWKLHFSVHPDDVPRAWDVVVPLYLSKWCAKTRCTTAIPALLLAPTHSALSRLRIRSRLRHESADGLQALACPTAREGAHRLHLPIGPRFREGWTDGQPRR